MVIRPATEGDLPAVTETLTVAFARDPVWGGWAFPDASRAMDLRRRFFGFWSAGCFRYGGLRVTESCEAVATWYPPGTGENTPEDERRLAAMAEDLLGAHAALFLQGCEVIEAHHPYGKPHYYLSMLGTHDLHRGKGLGMALLRDNLAAIDAEGVPAYLESTNPVNRGRYEALGFVKIGAYALPGGGPTIEQMWREPGVSSDGAPPRRR